MSPHAPSLEPLDERHLRISRRVSLVAAWTVVATSVVVLAGWFTGVRGLASLAPDATTVKANHAVGLLLAGLATVLLTSDRPRAARISRFLGVVVLAIGVVHLAEWAFSVDLGVDELLRRDFDVVAQPGRMAANSAFGLTFAGAALALADVRVRRWRPTETLALVATTTGLIALIGYAIDAPSLYDTGAKAAATGAALLVLLGVGIMAARPATGMMRTLSLAGPAGAMARRMLPGVLVVPTLLGVLRWQGERLGLFSTSLGILFLILAITAAMALLVWRLAAWLENTEAVRRAALSDLREANERFAGAFDHASVGMAIVSPDGAFAQVNDELCRIAGRRRDELLAIGFQEITHPDDLEKDLNLLEKLVAGEIDSYQMEKRYRHALGHYVWILLDVSLVRDEAGGPRYFVSLIQDITARREAEEGLARQHKQLVQAQSIARMGSWEYDLRTRTTEWSEEQFRIYGVDPEAGAPDADGYMELVHPEDRGLAAAPAPTAGEREYRVIRADDGEVVIVHTSTQVAETDADGNPVRVAGTAQDVTERREAETALRDAENLFRGAFQDAPIGMALADLEGRYMQVNEALATIVGSSRAELAGRRFEEVTHPDDRGADREALEDLTAGRSSSYNVEKRYLHSDGHPVWVAVHVNLIRGADGRPRHFLTQVQDVTERRRYESRLQHMADHDPLTSLLNRRSFERELREHVARVRRYGAEGAVILLDVDQFKAVNDTLGHKAGDDLLVRVARALEGRLRDSDILARMGGDEFAVLLPKEDADGAMQVAQALLERVREETRPTPGSSRAGHLTASVGVAPFGEEGALTGEDVQMAADVAMYDAKAAGRDQVALYSPAQPASR